MKLPAFVPNFATPARLARLKKIALISAEIWLGLLVTLAALGNWWLPSFVKQKVAEVAEQKIGRQVSLGDFSLNPLQLSVTLRDIRLYGPNKKDVEADLAELKVNLSSASLLHLAPVLEGLTIRAPRIDLIRYPSGRFNISDILERVLNQPSSPTPAFAISNIQLTDGQINYQDTERQVEHHLSALAFDLPFIANFPHAAPATIQPKLSGQLNQEPFSLSGEAVPFGEEIQAKLSTDLNHIQLAPIVRAIPAKLPVQLSSGELNGKLQIIFAQHKTRGTSALRLAGQVDIEKLALANPRGQVSGQTLIGFDKLALELAQVDLVAKTADVQMQFNTASLPTLLNGVLNGSLSAALKQTSSPTLAAAFTQGKLDITGRLLANWQTTPTLQVQAGSLHLRDAKLNALDGNKPLLQLANLNLDGIEVDSSKQNASIKKVSSSDSKIYLERGQDGKLNVEKLIVSPPSPTTSTNNKTTSPAWQVNVPELALSAWQIGFIDNSHPNNKQPIPLDIHDLSLQLNNLSTANTSVSNVNLNAKLNKNGGLKIAGTFNLPTATQKLAANLRIDANAISLAPFRGYVADVIDLTLARGELEAHGQAKVSDSGTGLALTYQGNAALNRLRTLDSEAADDLVKWNTLQLDGLDIALNPQANLPHKVIVKQIALADFYARLGLDSNGKLNLSTLVKQKEDAAPPPATNKPSPLIRIGGISLKRGGVNFTDNYIKPNYSANLTQLNGSISALASDTTDPANVDIQGQVDDAAPLLIAGTVQPLGPKLLTNIRAEARGIELPGLSPYAAKYAGYPISKGKLSVELQYKIENGQLSAQNRIFLDQLTFGERVDSPTATKLPVLLAVALLKNRKGEIDINLPISGSLDDPEFSIGGLIWQVIGNLISKAVTSPFALIGSLFGGGEELAFIDFEAGQHTLNAAANKKIDNLAQALRDRPSLTLDMTGSAQQADVAGVRQAVLQQRIKALKIRQLASQGQTIDPEKITISADEYPALLERVYKESAVNKPRNLVGLSKALPTAEMEKILISQIPVDKNALRDLATRRTASIRDALVAKGVPLNRIFILSPKVVDDSDPTPNPRVDFSLR